MLIHTLSRVFGATLLAVLALPGHAQQLEPITTCEAVGAARPICGFQNPEDLVVLPGEQALIVSEYGGMERVKAWVKLAISSNSLKTKTVEEASRFW